jgi:hypothetical protein
VRIYGVDFTSAPRPAKPITCARARLAGATLIVEDVERLTSLAAFEALLERPGPWVAAMDFPFAQPRRLVAALGWPASWEQYVARVDGMTIGEFVAAIDAYRATRPPGDRHHMRLCDSLCHAVSPMMIYGVPVGRMFFQGAPRLLRSGVSVVPCRPRDDPRVALEAYPRLVASRWIGRASYKSDDRSRQTEARRQARAAILDGLRSLGEAASAGQDGYGIAVHVGPAQVAEALGDGSGDTLDALLAAVQAAWAARQPNFGVPAGVDPGEGWVADPALAGG